jgi:hypothetical protein
VITFSCRICSLFQMEVALSRSDRCFSLLAVCQDHIQNGRADDAAKTVKVIRSEGRQFETAMNTTRRPNRTKGNNLIGIQTKSTNCKSTYMLYKPISRATKRT